MLAISRSTRVAPRLSIHTRALSAAAQNSGSPNAAATTECPDSNTAPDSTAKGHQERQTRRANTSVECMFVYPWNGIRTSAEGLAIARGVQDKFGPAKEVIFPRDAGYINIFQPYFWLVFDNPDIRKSLPEKSAQFSIQVADLPRGDWNVGVEEMMRGLGLSENENDAAVRESSPTPSEAEASKDASDVPPGYKTLDVRVEWAYRGPAEIFKRKQRISAPLAVKEKMLPHFASAWLAFDGFSPESARGPETPNLLRAREKWQKLAPIPSSSSSAPSANDDLATTAAVPPSQEPIDAGTGPESESVSASEAQTEEENVPQSREWVPIIPGGAQRPPRARTSITKGASASPPLDPAHIAESVDPHIADDSRAMPTTPSATTRSAENPSEAVATALSETAGHKMSRRERILHLARQNARTPLPKPIGEPQPPPAPTEAKMADEESERHVKERTIRERLWRLVGGNY